MRKPFNNDVHYDPGRLNCKITFVEQVTNPDGAGGTEISYVEVLDTWAVQESIRATDNLAVAEGVSALDGSCYFIVRNRRGFEPKKDMLVTWNGNSYTIRGIGALGRPVTHIRLLCAYRDLQNYD